jgi:hypothetical protein|nr:MAG TPA: hypothetical protein [Bacteriophage sp.]
MSENASITSLSTLKGIASARDWVSESFRVEDDGVYRIIEKGDTMRKDLVMPKSTFVEAFRKYIGGDL